MARTRIAVAFFHGNKPLEKGDGCSSEGRIHHRIGVGGTVRFGESGSLCGGPGSLPGYTHLLFEQVTAVFGGGCGG